LEIKSTLIGCFIAFPMMMPHQPTAPQTFQSWSGMHSILDEFRRENIMARGNSIVPFSQRCVSPKLIRTGLIGRTVYRRLHYLFLSTLQLTASNTAWKWEGRSIVEPMDQMVNPPFLAGYRLMRLWSIRHSAPPSWSEQLNKG
jgi:hypothetical protein